MAVDKGRRSDDDLIDWFTISYKTIYTIVGLVVIMAGGAGYWYYTRRAPEPTPPPETAVPATRNAARFTSLEGSVKVKAVGTFDWVTADKNTALRKSDLVKTGPGAYAEIEFFDGTMVRVRPDSLITIEETAEDPATRQRKVAYHISSGEVNLNTPRRNVPGSTVGVSTPTVSSTVGELANANIRVADTGETNLNLYTGNATVETKTGQKTELASNEGIRVDAGGKAGPKLALPPTPTILAPPHQAEISYPDPLRATTLFAWSPVPMATSYHLVVDFNPFFTKPFVDRKGIKDTSVQLRGLDEGKYYWRVAAVDKEDVEGKFSEFAKFTVARPAGAGSGQAGGPAPQLQVEAPGVWGNIVQVRGRTEPGSSVSVNGQSVDVQPDGSFNEFITLSKPGRQWVLIRATGMNGGVKEERRPITADF